MGGGRQLGFFRGRYRQKLPASDRRCRLHTEDTVFIQKDVAFIQKMPSSDKRLCLLCTEEAFFAQMDAFFAQMDAFFGQKWQLQTADVVFRQKTLASDYTKSAVFKQKMPSSYARQRKTSSDRRCRLQTKDAVFRHQMPTSDKRCRLQTKAAVFNQKLPSSDRK